MVTVGFDMKPPFLILGQLGSKASKGFARRMPDEVEGILGGNGERCSRLTERPRAERR
jgi:hypothetical protein